MNENIVEIKGLCKRFGTRELFKDLSLTVKRGEFVAVTGASGCGKTTLLNMIGGLEPYDSGTIRVDGIDVGKRKNRAYFYSDVIGFLFQNYVLMEDRSVRENLNISLVLCQTDKGHKLLENSKIHLGDVSIEKALEFVGLGYAADAKVYTLSGGEQQRVALARLMIKKCSLILADEPTGSLDKHNAYNVMRLLKLFNEHGRTVILVSHDPESVKWSDRVIYLGQQL